MIGKTLKRKTPVFFLLFYVIQVTACNTQQANREEQLRRTNDSLVRINNNLEQKVNRIDEQVSNLGKRNEAAPALPPPTMRISYAFTRILYTSSEDNNSDLRVYVSDVIRMGNLDESVKYHFMDDVQKDLKNSTFLELFIVRREFFNFETYEGASKEREKKGALMGKEYYDYLMSQHPPAQ